MAKKLLTNGESNQMEFDPVIVDEIIETKDKTTLHMTVDITRLRELVATYSRALKRARKIPLRLETLNLFDPKAKEAIQQFKDAGVEKPNTDEVLMLVRDYYETESDRIETQEAMILSMFTHPDNNAAFAVEPEKYKIEETELVPGVIEIKASERNLNDLAERRLKRLYDILYADSDIIKTWTRLFNEAALKMQLYSHHIEATQKSEAGFQS